MLIPSTLLSSLYSWTSLSRRVNANSQHSLYHRLDFAKLIKKGEC